jgi:hypothetical protein
MQKAHKTLSWKSAIVRRVHLAKSYLKGGPAVQLLFYGLFHPALAGCVRAFEIYMRERKTQLLRAAAYKIAGELCRARACSNGENGSREPPGRINKNFCTPI